MKNTLYNSFINKYPVSKTLRFELRPQGKTLENIEKNGLLEEDIHRAESYKVVKKIIDEYHKCFIDEALEGLRLQELDEFYDLYMKRNRTDKETKEFEEYQTSLRKQVSKTLKAHPAYKTLFSADLIKIDLLNFVEDDDRRKVIEEFSNFTTYFTNFHTNRENMYSDEAKSTSIAFRIIHQNLPKFIDNMNTFKKVAVTDVKANFSTIEKELQPIMQVNCVEEMFEMEYFNLTLTQQGIIAYNSILGGFDDGNNKQYKGLNQYINLYNQRQGKDGKLGKLNMLFKQILSDRITASFIPEMFESDQEVIDAVRSFYELEIDNFVQTHNVLSKIQEHDLERIYLRNDLSLTEISQKIFGDWSVIQNGLGIQYDSDYSGKKRPNTLVYDEEKKRVLKNRGSFSLTEINEAISYCTGDKTYNSIDHYYGACELSNKGGERVCFVNVIRENYEKASELLCTEYPKNQKLVSDQRSIDLIKSLLDAIKDFQRYLKPLLGKGDEAEKDETFYGEFLPLYERLDCITLLYNRVRNYVTQKPYSTEKIKLNFANSTLMNGWDLNKEADNTGTILKKDDLYYLAIMDKKANRVFKDYTDNTDNTDESTDYYEKMEYKLLPGPNKMLPKVFFSKSRIEEFAPSNEIMENYANNTHKKGETFNINDCRKLIDFFKKSINQHEDWKHFNFRFSPTDTYNDLSGFYREVEQQGYKITFRHVSADYIDRMVEEGRLYLFQIYNKDFSPHSKGLPNMHTLYWKELFSAENLNNVVYKLNGQAEVFFRKASITQKDMVTHEAGLPIKNKNKLNKKVDSTFEYELIKDKRYTVDKFQFHVPITMNFKSAGEERLNRSVNECIKYADDVHVIGIDRGERHLLYLTVINSQGEIVEQYSLNEIITGTEASPHPVNYHDLLESKEKNRTSARQNWKTIENIKELKEGYLSQVIYKISQLMLKYNAIVVL
ncbi:MAG: type V CRISPR-associated protein Cas12a/Cpf1, partial [Clostridia bacterium]|nr:type V CRISPR-associated protein Cas12a/Cpf1 [Clostridia bacterium]